MTVCLYASTFGLKQPPPCRQEGDESSGGRAVWQEPLVEFLVESLVEALKAIYPETLGRKPFM